ncbi:low affinity iron permease family protein [Flavihumibacter sp. CACIAM 22H1]|uniref:low affinity iron permease family protein n=1 Tax=Flavihumibacter sp. CACIAM 22H1 TaxID=1812911 RepID=UPI0007A7E200|nr:low affinity iron permease family protein [Flavihumibacter sp. CACIAM 22H1]KYP13183.1 MAG: hypothetical protein A1D16_02040 [Flavihumibacter sp. CACIAM 22H1]
MKKKYLEFFEKISSKITKWTGSPAVVLAAFLLIIIWGATGPFFNFSENWQLIINSSTTIITFLMVFIIQHSQNKDTLAIQMKLNELLATQKNASNTLINIEDLTEEDLEKIKAHYNKLAELSKNKAAITETHGPDEASSRHKEKESGN